MHLARHLHPDIVLMDVRMPVMDGLQATREILSAAADPGGRPRVLMLTTFDLDDYVYEALRAGASGFLLKDATGPTAYLIAGVYGLYTQWHPPAVTTPWLWPARPPHDVGSAICAGLAFACGLAVFSVRGARDSAGE